METGIAVLNEAGGIPGCRSHFDEFSRLAPYAALPAPRVNQCLRYVSLCIDRSFDSEVSLRSENLAPS